MSLGLRGVENLKKAKFKTLFQQLKDKLEFGGKKGDGLGHREILLTTP